ncbi:MAG: T9SS type A sorting domain-containing protein [bacterium]|nr:T9SS type A sorting domain-containing protein [bacterium]
MSRTINRLAVALAFLCLGAGASSANWMGGFILERGDTAFLGNSVHAVVTLDYKVTSPNGARILVYPFENGSLVAGYSWGGSPTYPTGTTGTAGNYLTFTTGTHHMDSFRVRMIDPVTSTTLLDIYLPADYTFANNAVNEIAFSHSSPSWLLNGENLVIDFACQTDEAAGVRVSARPYSGGSLSPGYTASGVATVPMGSGTGQQWFRFNTGTHDVDAVRFQVWNSTLSTLLLEFFVPVDLHWGDHSIKNITLNPPFPECLAWGQNVTVEFDYATSNPAGCLAWAYGETEGNLILFPQTYSGSVALPVRGHLSRTFRMDAGEGQAAYVRLLMKDVTNTTNLLSVTIPADYHFGRHAIRDVVFTPASPAVLDLGEYVNLTYNYVTTEAGGVKIQPLPYTYEALSPRYGVNSSPVYPVGAGSGSGYLSILVAPASLVTRAGIHMYDSAWAGPLHSCWKPVNYTFGGTGGVTAAPDLPDPAAIPALALGQNFPNPFNPLTEIPVDLAAPAHVTVRVYDLRGRLVADIADGVLPEGRTVFSFDGSRLASGEYLYVARTPDGSRARRMVLLK